MNPWETVSEVEKFRRVRRMVVPGGWIYEIAVLDVGSGNQLRESFLLVPGDTTPVPP